MGILAQKAVVDVKSDDSLELAAAKKTQQLKGQLRLWQKFTGVLSKPQDVIKKEKQPQYEGQKRPRLSGRS